MLTVLKQIMQEVSATYDFQEAMNLAVHHIANALVSESCSIFLFDRKHGDYVLAATKGLNTDCVGKTRIPINKGLVGLVGEREEPVNIEDAKSHPRFLQLDDLQEELYHAFLGTPIIFQRQVLGVLLIQHTEWRKYDEAEEAFLVTIATQLAAVIAHAEAVGGTTHFTSQNEKEAAKPQEFLFTGIPGSPGIGIGKGVVVFIPSDLNSVPDREPEDLQNELYELKAAFSAVRQDLAFLRERLSPTLSQEELALFEVYEKILEGDHLEREVIEHIEAGNWAQGALRTVIDVHVRRLESLDNEYMRERTVDIQDLGRRLLSYLQKQTRTSLDYQPNTILVGDVISPTDLAEVPESFLKGIISIRGSRNSHLAILARAMRIPTVMGLTEAPIHEWQDHDIIVDGHYGQVYINPSAVLQEEFKRLHEEEKRLDSRFEEIRDLPAKTKDKHVVNLFVNTGLGSDINIALLSGAEGIGLYRTEIPFMIRERFPSSEEQRIIYRQLLSSFAPKPVTIRTLDVGGDKPLPYFPIVEDNPFLGWRGIRITLDHPDIFLSQIRAMMRASDGLNNLRIMLPMITDVNEVDEALRLIEKAYAEVCAEGYEIEKPQVGLMIEVPSAVYQARSLAKRVDFLSVGSNDLTQYILAVDRNNPRVANLYNSLHPSVLKALIQVVDSGHHEGKHVSICGEMAGDPISAVLLLAMGFDSFSMNASSIGRIKWLIRHFSHAKAASLLQDVLSMENVVLIRDHLELALEKADLGNLIRAGR